MKRPTRWSNARCRRLKTRWPEPRAKQRDTPMRLLDDLQAGLAAIDAAHLRRVRRTAYSPTDRSQRISVPGEAPRDILGFCGNDYLGLAAHPALAEAMTQGTQQYGFGSGASHLVSGHSIAHARLEARM